MRVILFTERNSPFGAGVMGRISSHPAVQDLLVVTRDPSRLCDYYIYDATPVSVSDAARQLNRPLLETDEIHSDEAIDRFRNFAPDLVILANYQLKVRESVIRLAKRLAINFHPSPLPRYAGLAPFFWMARNGEKDVGVSCCLVSDKIDGGELVHSQKVLLSGEETSGEIREKLFAASFMQVETVFDLLSQSEVQTVPQDLDARTYFGKPGDADLTIDWNQSTDTVMRFIRAGAPLPGAITLLTNGEQVRIRDAQRFSPSYRASPGTVSYHQGLPVIHTGDGAVRITSYTSYCPAEIQPVSGIPLRFDLTAPPPKHSSLALLASGPLA